MLTESDDEHAPKTNKNKPHYPKLFDSSDDEMLSSQDLLSSQPSQRSLRSRAPSEEFDLSPGRPPSLSPAKSEEFEPSDHEALSGKESEHSISDLEQSQPSSSEKRKRNNNEKVRGKRRKTNTSSEEDLPITPLQSSQESRRSYRNRAPSEEFEKEEKPLLPLTINTSVKDIEFSLGVIPKLEKCPTPLSDKNKDKIKQTTQKQTVKDKIQSDKSKQTKQKTLDEIERDLFDSDDSDDSDNQTRPISSEEGSDGPINNCFNNGTSSSSDDGQRTIRFPSSSSAPSVASPAFSDSDGCEVVSAVRGTADTASSGMFDRAPLNRFTVKGSTSGSSSVVDLTISHTSTLHDIVDLTSNANLPPAKTKGFELKKFSDCDILSVKTVTKGRHNSDDDIIVVAPDCVAKTKKTPAAGPSNSMPIQSNTEADELCTLVATPPVPYLSLLGPPPGTAGVSNPSIYPSNHPSANHPSSSRPPSAAVRPYAAVRPPNSAPPLIRPATPGIRPATPSMRSAPPGIRPATPSMRPATPGIRPPAAVRPPAPPATSAASSSGRSSMGLTVSGVVTAAYNAFQQITGRSAAATPTTAALTAAVTAAVSTPPAQAPGSAVLTQRQNRHNRTEYRCDCARCKGNVWFLTSNTVKDHRRRNGVMTDALPALDSASATTPGGPSAHAQTAARLAAHNQAAARLAAQQQAARAAQALQLARHSLAQAQAQAANRGARPLQAPCPVPGPTGYRAPPYRPPAPFVPTLPPATPDVPEDLGTSEPGLSCPICLDTKNQIVASNRNLVSTNCGHIFCSHCIVQVTRTNKKCPTCRKTLTGKNCYHNIYI